MANDTEREILEYYSSCEFDENCIRKLVALWTPLTKKDFIDSVESAVIGSIFGKLSMYYDFINFSRELTDDQLDAFNQVFTKTVEDNRELIRKSIRGNLPKQR